MKYFVQQNQIVSGPYSLEDLRARLQRGENAGADQVCAEGSDRWISLRDALQQEPAALSSSSAAPRSKRKLGCGGCLLIALASCALLAVALAVTAYYIVFHTVAPIKWMGALAGPGFSMSGVSGSISSGFAIKSMRWQSANGEMCEIEDLRLKYSGFSDFAKRGELIISEVNVGKARLVITTTEASSADHPSFISQPAPRPNNGAQQLKVFRVDRVHFGDVYVKDLRTGFEFSMPAFDYTGLKVEEGKVDLGDLHIESDRLDVRTQPGRTVQIGGKTVVFNKLIEGTAKPLLHPAIKRPIKFTLDVGVVDKKGLTYHLTACEDRLEIYFAEGQSGFYRASELPLADYLSVKPYDLPSKVTLDGTMPAKGTQPAGKVLVPKGHFTLGATEFELEAGEVSVETNGTGAPYEITARHRGAGEEIVAALKFQSADPQVGPVFRSTPAMAPKDLLAQIFFGKAYGELPALGQTEVAAKIPVYFLETVSQGK